ncbi:hypothetical protein BDV59DRAFT_207713 [Aspergillus ambiguus]|uniref:uncharacterized protein n=1 Tax=Aspergillus ambiguus TaxID=176160 RepID=UPI003CCCA071
MNVTQDAHVQPLFRRLFNYADKTNHLDLEDWVSILTLSFSPLIAHVLSGVPTVVRRHPKPPTWLDTLCLYNPTTILWRYLAIAVRRARYHRTWNSADMAATNALFWTSDGFDGSEEIMFQSRTFCTRVPTHSRTKFLSIDTLKTIITTLQGIQAGFVLVRGILAQVSLRYNHPFNATMAMDTVFYPLAIFGLLRLFAAPWLTELYSFAEHNIYDSEAQLTQHNTHHALSYPMPPSAEDSEMGTKYAVTSTDGTHLNSARHLAFGIIMIRTCYVLILLGLLGLCVSYITPIRGAMTLILDGTSALILVAVVYIFMSGMSVILFTIYLIRGGLKTTTVIPCIRTWWYRLYTLVLIAAALALLVLSGYYTRRAPCGQLTMFPALYDNQVCNGTPVKPDADNAAVGFIVRNTLMTPSTWMVPLDGWCSGTMVDKLIPLQQVE